jgi:hypothetical protein
MEAWAKAAGNLSPLGSSRRLRASVVLLAIGLALGVVLVESGASAWWRLVLFAPFFLSSWVLFQGLYRT